MKLNSISPAQCLFPGAILLALLLHGCGSTPPDAGAGNVELQPTIATSTSNRQVFAGCDSAEAVKKYADMVGENVLISWAWNNANEQVNSLEVPATVLRVDSPYLVVVFNPEIPNVEFYSAVWLTSGHVKAMPEGGLGVDMCSATLKKGEWQ